MRIPSISVTGVTNILAGAVEVKVLLCGRAAKVKVRFKEDRCRELPKADATKYAAVLVEAGV